MYRLGTTGTYHGLPVLSSGYLEVSTMGESGDLTGPAAASGSLGGRKTLSSPSSWRGGGGGGNWFRYTSSTAHVFSSSSGTKARPPIRKVHSKLSTSMYVVKWHSLLASSVVVRTCRRAIPVLFNLF
jgi:hypothetical protein